MRHKPMPAWASGRRRSLGGGRGGPSSSRFTQALVTIGLFALVTAAIYLIAPDPGFEGRGQPLVGYAGHVVDGDTLDVEGQRVRLLGLDAPELGQTCADASGGIWACGSAASARLRQLVRGKELRCAPDGHDRYGRLLATCRTGTTDLSATMVAEGLAVSDVYLAEQAAARAKRAGVWQGAFTVPSVWREQEGRAVESGGNPSRFERFLAWLMGLFTN